MSGNLLFMMPNYHAATEVWLWRMIDLLETHVNMIAVKDSAGVSYWKNGVPVFSLRKRPKQVRGLSSLLTLLGFDLTTRPKDRVSKLKNEIKRQQIDKVLCQYGTFAVQNRRWLQELDLPLFIHFHGYDVFFDLLQAENPVKRLHDQKYLDDLKRMEKKAVFIAGSQFIKSKLIAAGFNESNIHVKYYGTPLPQYQKKHIKNQDLQILHLGRLVDFKSPDRTIKAFEIARSKGLKANLVIVGNGPLKVACELLRVRSPYRESISILDPIPPEQALQIYFASDIFTQHNVTGELTNQAEGFGVSIIEAMAVGLPFVGTQSGGVVESVVDRETGFLNEPGDIEAQANSFIELANNPDIRQKMGEAGRKRVAEHYSPELERERLFQIMGLDA